MPPVNGVLFMIFFVSLSFLYNSNIEDILYDLLEINIDKVIDKITKINKM
jgi:hypothetical protein